MFRSLQSPWAQLCVLYLSLAAFAEDDPKYDPASNFRPHNVTGLPGLWPWVGSYYNATLEMEFTPLLGYTTHDPVCGNQKNRTIVSKWPAILSITDRGTYQAGINPVNLFLSYHPPDFNMSSLPDPPLVHSLPTLAWPLESTDPVWPFPYEKWANDHYNLTVTKASPSSFALNATLHTDWGGGNFGNITMPACNTTMDTDQWHVNLIEHVWWRWRGWRRLAFPELTVEFNDKSANLTLEGYYQGMPYVQEPYKEGGPTLAGNGNIGWIRMRFNGTLDAYHSDVLDVNASSPTWLRTVGFGNNSANVGYGNGGPGSIIPWLGGVGVASFVALAVMF